MEALAWAFNRSRSCPCSARSSCWGGRSETIRGLRGDGRDELFRQVDIHATALAGIVVLTAIIVAFLVEVARGQDGGPYSWLGAIGGLSYLVAVVALRLRG